MQLLLLAAQPALTLAGDNEEYVFYLSFEDNTPVDQANHLIYQMAINIYSTFDYYPRW